MSTDESPGSGAPPDSQEPVPRLPRGRGLSLSGPEILRILMFVALLVAVITLRQPCSNSAGKFINAFEPPPDAAPSQARPGNDLPPGHYIRLTPDMSEDEIRQKIDQLAGTDPDEPAQARDAGPAPADAAP